MATAAAVVVSVWTLGDIAASYRLSGVGRGWPVVREQLARRFQEGTRWPWQAYWPAGPVPDAIRYVRECTVPSDRFLVSWAASEYYYYAGRAFAGGHAQLLAPRAFRGARDQALMLARMQTHRVPVVFVNETGRDEFQRTYPLLEAYVREHYRAVGEFRIRNDEEIVAVLVREDLRGTSTFGPGRWPCGFFAPVSQALS
jgi:hypothetical protein